MNTTYRMTLVATAAAMALMTVPVMAQTPNDGGAAKSSGVATTQPYIVHGQRQAGGTGAIGNATMPDAQVAKSGTNPGLATQSNASQTVDADQSDGALPASGGGQGNMNADAGASQATSPNAGEDTQNRQVASGSPQRDPRLAARVEGQMREMAQVIYNEGFREGIAAAQAKFQDEQQRASAQAAPEPQVRAMRNADGSTLLLLPAGMSPQQFAQTISQSTQSADTAIN